MSLFSIFPYSQLGKFHALYSQFRILIVSPVPFAKFIFCIPGFTWGIFHVPKWFPRQPFTCPIIYSILVGVALWPPPCDLHPVISTLCPLPCDFTWNSIHSRENKHCALDDSIHMYCIWTTKTLMPAGVCVTLKTACPVDLEVHFS